MATTVIMPALGMAQETGTLVSWLRKEGEEVTKGEPLMEVETDKAVVEVEAPASGRLAAVRAVAGDQIPVGEVIAYVLGPGEEAPEPAPGGAGSRPQAAIAEEAADAAGAADASGTGGSSLSASSAASPQGGTRLAAASPKARRLAQEMGVGLDQVTGSGPRGAVLASDVLSRAPAPGLETGRLWRRMAQRTFESWSSAPHFYLFREVAAGRLISWRASLKGQGIESSYSDLLLKVVSRALVLHPRANARWEDGVALQSEVNVALAVATPEGLVAPVIHGSDRMSVAEIARRRAELVERARSGRLRPEDVLGGTFTLTNLGMYGVDAFNAILNSGQGGILAVGRIADRVVAVAGRPEVRPMMTLSLSCDHRVIDGARGAEFLQRVADLIEEPAGLLG